MDRERRLIINFWSTLMIYAATAARYWDIIWGKR